MDLCIWKKGILATRNGMPIGLPPMGPPITAVKFMSDAAGAANSWTKLILLDSLLQEIFI